MAPPARIPITSKTRPTVDPAATSERKKTWGWVHATDALNARTRTDAGEELSRSLGDRICTL